MYDQAIKERQKPEDGAVDAPDDPDQFTSSLFFIPIRQTIRSEHK